ncbi:MAG: hypothetical protein LBG72_06865 [Spirochaetaceae bacterium]|jgi:hypothetical protein|nr:hypothetical protein [Spirochaetaceae bacterium]
MGLVRDKITITNSGDIAKARAGFINNDDIRRVTVTALADTGALMLVIPETIRKELGLFIEKQVSTSLADGSKKICGLTEPVNIEWQDRLASCQAWVVPEDCNVLLGAIPMEAMDIMVDPGRRQLTGIHGDQVLGILC